MRRHACWCRNPAWHEAISIAREAAEQVTVGRPDEGTTIGPVASKAQFDKVQRLIQKGVDEGATVVVGGPGRPAGLDTGYYVKPTVFANVTNDMTIAREEIFGPVLCILGYDDLDHAVADRQRHRVRPRRLRVRSRPRHGSCRSPAGSARAG